MIVIRTHDGGVEVYSGWDEEAYTRWGKYPETGDERPKPTMTLDREDANALVMELLRGPPGPMGMPGPMGRSGAD